MKAILIVSAVMVLLVIWPIIKMAGICSREEEREWEDGC